MEIKIAVCDDCHQQTEYIKMLVNKWAEGKYIKVTVDMFESSENFKSAWSEGKAFDILLLDIEMGGQNGVELARDLRKTDEKLVIIFITGFADYISDGYDVSALHYLMKPVNEDKFFEVLDRATERLKKAEQTLLVQTTDTTAKIPLDDILYIEAFAHYVVIQTKTASTETRANISEIEKSVGYGFVRCHRSYIVGLNHISRITKTDVILDNGKTIPLSRRLYTEINLAFIEYHKGRKK